MLLLAARLDIWRSSGQAVTQDTLRLNFFKLLVLKVCNLQASCACG